MFALIREQALGKNIKKGKKKHAKALSFESKIRFSHDNFME